MLIAYRPDDGGLARLAPDAPLSDAVWIDAFEPDATEIDMLVSLGVDPPTLAEMEEIELSNRLYREGDIDTMTAVMTGQTAAASRITGPVSFILSPTQLVTLRFHAPRPFDTYPERAEKVGPGCDTADQVFLGLCEEIIGRQADHLEFSGRALDEVSAAIYATDPGAQGAHALQATLRQIGQEGEMLGKVRLALLTLGRAISFYQQTMKERPGGKALSPTVQGLMRDIQALEVHADFLSSRVALSSDATLGMIDLSQNATVRIVSVVAVLFLPPTLIASIYGMNFDGMPELAHPLGYIGALVAMVASAAGTWAYFKWRKWL